MSTIFIFISFSVDDRPRFSNKSGRETSPANRVVLRGLTRLCKICFWFMNIFRTFSYGQQTEKNFLYLRAALFSDPHFRFVESHGGDLQNHLLWLISLSGLVIDQLNVQILVI